MSKTLMEKLNDLASKAGFKFESKEGKVELSKIAEVKLSAEAKLEDGTMIATTADAWGPGVDILVVDAEGKTTPAMDGEYKLETGETVVVVDGLVSEIRPVEVEEEVEMEAEIKRSGKWDEYEQQMMNNNKNAMLDDFETSFEEFINSKAESYMTEAGDVETWGGGKVNEEEIKNVKEYIKKLREHQL